MAEAATVDTVAQRLDKLYEFERAPVTPDKLQDGRYFAAMFAGEHVAGTEFIIGALFVQWGATASDLIWGLLVGNLLAVLSWAFVCAPIAVRTRLTLYWYVRRIIGPGLTVVYNIINSVLYCCLAAAMIGVSASAVLLGFNRYFLDARNMSIPHPGLDDVYPNSLGWVAVVLLVGALTTLLAIYGFKKLSQFAAVCSPWMFPIFLAGALATLPGLGNFRNFGELWTLLETKVWNGVSATGDPPLGFWHIMFFAWFCNLAMHIGLSDMAVFRYARKWQYGFYSAFGMFLGHYLAWICAGIMGAVLGNALNPGEMADRAAGIAGLLCVLLAGWTTANPTIYRAGLALQIITPNWPRWRITLVAGAITTFIAFFPAIFMKLLGFVAIYGLVLMPIGTIIVIEHWLFPRLGLRQYWTQARGLGVNGPALVTWAAVLLLALPFEAFTGGRIASPMHLMGIHLYFRWLICWVLAAGLYVLLCYIWPGTARGVAATAIAGIDAQGASDNRAERHTGGRTEAPNREADLDTAPTPLMWVAGAAALLSLAIIVYLAMRVFLGGSDPVGYQANLAGYKRGLALATGIYFVASIYWQSRREQMRAAASA